MGDNATDEDGIRALFYFLALLAGAGLFLCALLSLLAILFSLNSPGGLRTFLVFSSLPVIVAAFIVGMTTSMRFGVWRDVRGLWMRAAPRWAIVLLLASAGYALLVYLIGDKSKLKGTYDPPAEILPSIGVIYAGAFCVFLSAGATGVRRRRCPEGHPVLPGDDTCDRCGKPVAPIR